jgi:hypothetical protein
MCLKQNLLYRSCHGLACCDDNLHIIHGTNYCFCSIDDGLWDLTFIADHVIVIMVWGFIFVGIVSLVYKAVCMRYSEEMEPLIARPMPLQFV